MKKPYITPIILILFLLTHTSASSHGLGIKQEQISGDYLIEFEQEEFEVIQDQSVPYTTQLRTGSDKELVDFDEVQIRFTDQDSRTIASFRTHPDHRKGTSNFYIPLPNEGIYSVSINFLVEDESIAKASFDIDVIAEEKPFNYLFIALPALGILTGSIITLLVKKTLKGKSFVKNKLPSQKK